jgi:hypothetical protein
MKGKEKKNGERKESRAIEGLSEMVFGQSGRGR